MPDSFNLPPAERRRRLAYLDGQITVFSLLAQWQIARAMTGSATRDKTCHLDGTPVSDERKIDAALQAARQHIEWIQESIETRAELMRGELED